MNQYELEKIKQEAWDKFYYAKEAQSFCFGNHNNATRDEQVGEFSFNGGFDCGVETLQKELNEAMELMCEIRDIVQGHIEDGDKLDSFTMQPIKAFLAKVKGRILK